MQAYLCCSLHPSSRSSALLDCTLANSSSK